ncbi:hypothetical protein DSO57_1030839 [Entomophthora muscae]|uniref:Uncharacterized protein n=3 Tax=Entomophthora muscae TaxID=34485 RepID=A0ACC2ULJ7_9FUNG|nr:hypothetical protein DSO57_1030839 [Entomophthora muscae]
MDYLANFLASSKVRVVIPDSQLSCDRLKSMPTSFTRIPNRETLHHGEDFRIFLLLLSQEPVKYQQPNSAPNQEVPYMIRSLFGQMHIFIEAHVSKSKYNDHKIGSPPSCTSACGYWALEPELVHEPYITSTELGSKYTFNPTISQRSGCFPAWIPYSSIPPIIFNYNNSWAAMYPLKVTIGSGAGSTGYTRLHLGYIIGRPKQPHLKAQNSSHFSDDFIINSPILQRCTSSSSSEDSDFGVIDCDQTLLRQFVDPGKIYQHIVVVSPQFAITIDTLSDNRLLKLSLDNNMTYTVELTGIVLSSISGNLNMLAPAILPIKLLPGEKAQFFFRFSTSNSQPFLIQGMGFVEKITAEIRTKSEESQSSAHLTYYLSLSRLPPPSFIEKTPALKHKPLNDTFSTNSKSSRNTLIGRMTKGLTLLLPSFNAATDMDSQPITDSPGLFLSEELIVTLQAEGNVVQGRPCLLQITIANQSSRPRNLSIFFSSKQIAPLVTTNSSRNLQQLPNQSKVPIVPWEISPELNLKRYTFHQSQTPCIISPQTCILLPLLQPNDCLSSKIDIIPLSHIASPTSSLWLVDNDLHQSLEIPHLEVLPLQPPQSN